MSTTACPSINLNEFTKFYDHPALFFKDSDIAQVVKDTSPSTGWDDCARKHIISCEYDLAVYDETGENVGYITVDGTSDDPNSTVIGCNLDLNDFSSSIFEALPSEAIRDTIGLTKKSFRKPGIDVIAVAFGNNVAYFIEDARGSCEEVSLAELKEITGRDTYRAAVSFGKKHAA